MDNRTVIRATELSGRAVVDLDAAEKVGKVDRIVLDPDARQVAGLLVSRGAAVAGERMHMTVPAGAVHAIGPDAVMIHRPATVSDEMMRRLDELPSVSDLIGRKVVTEDGRLIGRVDDVLLNRDNGRILGYTLGGHDVVGKLEGLFRGGRKGRTPYLSADAELRAGDDLIVAPDNALRDDWEAAEPGAAPSPVVTSAPGDTVQARVSTWTDCPVSRTPSSWFPLRTPTGATPRPGE